MFVERKVCYSALFTYFVRWHTSAVSFPLSDVILAQQACPLSDIIFCLHSGIINLSLYKNIAFITITNCYFNCISLTNLKLLLFLSFLLQNFKLFTFSVLPSVVCNENCANDTVFISRIFQNPFYMMPSGWSKL
jgi:hypothetical protein